MRNRIILALAWMVSILIAALIIIFLIPVVLFWLLAAVLLFIISLFIGLFSLARQRLKKKGRQKASVRIKDL
ncbi:MAG: hypothetical protein QXW00_04335 [Candidatus Woesearchaeota archaeon]